MIPTLIRGLREGIAARRCRRRSREAVPRRALPAAHERDQAERAGARRRRRVAPPPPKRRATQPHRSATCTTSSTKWSPAPGSRSAATTSTINARLTWVSPLRTKYIFTSRARRARVRVLARGARLRARRRAARRWWSSRCRCSTAPSAPRSTRSRARSRRRKAATNRPHGRSGLASRCIAPGAPLHRGLASAHRGSLAPPQPRRRLPRSAAGRRRGTGRALRHLAPVAVAVADADLLFADDALEEIAGARVHLAGHLRPAIRARRSAGRRRRCRARFGRRRGCRRGRRRARCRRRRVRSGRCLRRGFRRGLDAVGRRNHRGRRGASAAAGAVSAGFVAAGCAASADGAGGRRLRRRVARRRGGVGLAVGGGRARRHRRFVADPSRRRLRATPPRRPAMSTSATTAMMM